MFRWQKKIKTEEVARIFAAPRFLWGFIVAWEGSQKTGDEVFVAGQLKALKKFERARVAAAATILAETATTLP